MEELCTTSTMHAINIPMFYTDKFGFACVFPIVMYTALPAELPW